MNKLQPAALSELPLGAIKPTGWLLDQLKLQANGLTGHLDDIWPDVGPTSGWLGGDGENWERGPYYLDGLLPLAHLLEDARLLEKVKPWIEWTLASQEPNGDFGPRSNPDPWPRMVMLKVLMQHFDATGDARVIPFFTRYFRYQLETLPKTPLRGWGQARGAENVLVVDWLYAKTQEPFLLELNELILAQTLDWGAYLTERLIEVPATVFDHFTHVVNVAMGLKTPAMNHLLGRANTTGTNQLEVVARAFENLDRLHGMPNGMFSGDEWLAGLGPERGTELCAVVELMFSLEHLTRIFGEASFADRLELVAYNALPATISADMRSHQYLQQVNQVLCTIAPRDWTMSSEDSTTFGLEPHFGCCTANLHQGWPKLVRSLWMGTPNGGLAAVVYAPSRVTTSIAGQTMTLETITEYPFKDTIKIKLDLEHSARFELRLRVPAWCEQPQLSINGETFDSETRSASRSSQGFIHLEREWQAHDEITLVLPMTVRKLERPLGALSLALGPLVLALWPGEIWYQIPATVPVPPAGATWTPEGFGDWEVKNRRPWNYALEIASDTDAAQCQVERFDVTSPPFSVHGTRPDARVARAPLKVFVPARRLLEWTLDTRGYSASIPPQSPVSSLQPTFIMEFVPYGCARLRTAEFPRLESKPSHSER